MAIYTGGLRQRQEAQAEASRLAKKQEKAAKKEGKRKKWSGLLGSIGGALAGAAAVGITGLTGGLAAPLVAGAATSLTKKWVDEGTKKGRFGKGLRGADPSQIQATGKYGYGMKQAEQIREGIKESRKTDWGADTMLGDIASSYLTAGLSGGLGGAKDALKAGNLKSALGGTGVKGMAGLKQAMAGLIPGGEGASDFAYDSATGQMGFGGAGAVVDHSDPFVFGQDDQSLIGPLQEGGKFAQGGQVLSQEELLMLLALAEAQDEKAYDNTPLEEVQQPTISEYFASQGKTLGGNNTQSIAQLMGR